MKRNFIFSVLILFLWLVSCKKETIVKQIPIVHSWTLDSSLQGYNKILTTALTLNDSVLAAANSYQIWYVNTHQLNKSINGVYILNQSYLSSTLVPPSLSKDVSVSIINSNMMNVFATYNAGYSANNSFSFTPTFSNTANTVKGFPLLTSPTSAAYPVIKSRYILAPVELFVGNQPVNQAIFNLIKINVTAPSYNTFNSVSVSLNSVKSLTVSPLAGSLGFSDGLYASMTYFDKFFVTYENNAYRVDTLGNFKNITNYTIGLHGFTNMFILNNYLFGLFNGRIFISLDQGETWSLFLDGSGTNYANLTYFNVSNEVYASFQSQIWRVTLSGSTLNYKELDNDGLQTNQITAINKCGKYAFVSTLSGLFYRDTTSLNTFKK